MATQHIAFRTDANSQIGTGHFMRCLTLADTLKQHGGYIRFICRDLPIYLCNMLAQKGMEFTPLNSNDSCDTSTDELAHAHWLGTSQAQDAQATIHLLSDKSWDWLIVDHYALDTRWESKLRQSAAKILVIDDIADRQHDCDMLLDQNYYSNMDSRYTGKVPGHCRLLLGPRYALLRDEFRHLHKQTKPRSGPVKRVLVFFGGVDADNYTERVIEAISGIDNIPDLHIDIIIGAQHPFREQIKTACALYGFVCHVQTDRMAELMSNADLAIGAGGSASWERCCLGLPTLTFCTAENQKNQVADAALNGLLYSPEIKNDLVSRIQRHFITLLENNFLRQLISRKSIQAVNGRGTLQLNAIMGNYNIKIRMATLDDSKQLFRWRNDPSIREVSRNADIIEWEDHKKWLTSILFNSKKTLLIGQSAKSTVGVVRFDMQNHETEISIYLVPEKLSSGVGHCLLRSAEQWLTANYPRIRHIKAHVLAKNIRSHRLFSSAGYEITSTCYSKKMH